MKLRFRKSFARDLRKNRDPTLQSRLRKLLETAEAAKTLEDLPGLSKISGAQGFYRIRLGDYRLGIFFDDGTLELVRCLHRRDIYRYFP